MAGPVRSVTPSRALPMLAGAVALLLAGGAFGLIALEHAPGTAAPSHAEPAAAMLLAAGLAGLLALGLSRRIAMRDEAGRAQRDPLTGLPGHACFRARLAEMLSLARRQGWQVGVLVLDLRHFREVNEVHGQLAGDLALRLVATRLRNAVRLEDLVARLAGDRFAVAQTSVQDPGAVPRLAERLAAAIAEPLPLDGVTPFLHADIGLAVAPPDGQDAGTLLARAEDALALARAAPQPAIQCFAPEQNALLRDRRQLERDLREAVAEGRFEIHWQPQRRLSDGALTGFEALLRWPHPTRGLIPPGEFIPLAEATGLIIPLGAWVLREAAREAASWPGDLTVAVNLSAVQLRGEGLVTQVREALRLAGLPASRLELEVTESALIDESQMAADTLAELQALGVRIALDDFGTGWSSLAYLRHLPVDVIKTDRGFVRDMEADPRVAAVVAAILALGRSLGVSVLAEGIETETQARQLRALGCEHGQGWLLGRPMRAEQTRALIAEEARTRRAA
ncbi:putative bifunctional diguanylate cyclase/phosphodiesterase [Falsiroseomonas oryziterrae]|uniref:putative bifunctional diguanylate cyclase/phosphodiesterase n=1 Tax=Falsiroseomonas oryziterrae TaxID=2911368 RepID=UPI001F2E30F8|nr:bifunctional diguanylate cyclase/phosphodiesterase [Roseomonas sp. NPKOSM-4]